MGKRPFYLFGLNDYISWTDRGHVTCPNVRQGATFSFY